MIKHLQAKSTTATLANPEKYQRQAGSTKDEIHCTLCDCSEFRQSRPATVCTCGHHYEDHEIPEAKKGKKSRF